jgi:hypothetical protein
MASLSRREVLIRRCIHRLSGLDRQVAIDAYRHLKAAHLVGSEGVRGLRELDRDYPAQGVFDATRNSDGTYAFALDRASDMLQAEVALSPRLDPAVREALDRVLHEFIGIRALDQPTGKAIERGLAAGFTPQAAHGSGQHDVVQDTVVQDTATSRGGATWVPYAPVSERPAAIQRDPFPFDPDARDRATLAHMRTQNRLAEWAADRGFTVQASAGEPQVDLAWTDGKRRTIVEVKTINLDNEARQLRLGLGQLLDYHDQLAMRGEDVILTLATDRKPSDPRWSRLCERYGVLLVWP